jgi:hypothetical protein
MNKQQAMQFLSELIDRINEQDNRCTAKPYFYVIKTKRYRLTERGYAHGDSYECKYDHDMGAEYKREEEDKYIENCIEAGYCDTREEAKERWDNLEIHEMEEYDTEDNVFLTEHGYNQHVELNGHNLGRQGQYYSYVKHAFRNPEMYNLLKAVAAITDKEIK